MLYTCICPEQPKVGIKADNGDAIGFVFINYDCSLSDARKEISTQVIDYKDFKTHKYTVIDINLQHFITELRRLVHFTPKQVFSQCTLSLTPIMHMGKDDIINAHFLCSLFTFGSPNYHGKGKLTYF